ncbi:MAG: TetR/AcrR family transcriptional regulator [Acidimicrobiales bacterium]
MRGASQDRSRQRRQALLRAAIELLGERGAKAVTHRAVSIRAGLPPASAGYYFASIDDLTVEALLFHVAERKEALTTLLRQAVAGATTIDEVAPRVARSLVSGESGVGVAQFEVYLEAARNPALRPAVAEAIAAFEQAAADTLTTLGISHAREAAAVFVAMLDGFALHRLAAPRPAEADVRSMEEAIRSLFIIHAIDDGEREALRKRFREPPGGAIEEPE